MPISSASAVLTATIANGASLSDEIDMGGYNLLGIIMPAAWDAAAITFAASDATGGTFVPVYDDAGAEISVTAAAGHAIGIATTLKAGSLAPFRFVKLRSGTAGAAVNQTAQRTLLVVVERG